MATKKKSTKKTSIASPPIEAAESGKLRNIKDYLEAGGNIDMKATTKDTLLLAAVRNGRENVALYLIAEGANVDAGDYRRSTALHYASEFGLAKLTTSLLSAGADPNAGNAGNQRPLHRAALCERTGKSGELLGAFDHFPKANKKKTIAALLDGGADAFAVDYGGRTAKDLLSDCPNQDGATQLSQLEENS